MYYTTKFNSSKILYFGTFSQQQHYLNRCHCCKFVNPQNLFYSNHSKKKRSQTITMTINVLMGVELLPPLGKMFSPA